MFDINQNAVNSLLEKFQIDWKPVGLHQKTCGMRHVPLTYDLPSSNFRTKTLKQVFLSERQITLVSRATTVVEIGV